MSLFVYKKNKKATDKSKSIGATAVEYTLIASLIAVMLVGAYRRVGTGYSRIYNNIASVL